MVYQKRCFPKQIYALLNGIKTGIIHNNTRETVDIVVKLPENERNNINLIKISILFQCTTKMLHYLRL